MHHVIALGFFDGVHLGHAALMRRANEMSQCLGVPSLALTFDSHPDELLY
jgi:riboflavin kinase/FMN adenylyltransferase